MYSHIPKLTVQRRLLKTNENQHHASILGAKYYLSVYNVYFKLASFTK